MLRPAPIAGDLIAVRHSSLAPIPRRTRIRKPGHLRDSTGPGTVPDELAGVSQNQSSVGPRSILVSGLGPLTVASHRSDEVHGGPDVDAIAADGPVGPDAEVLGGFAEEHDDAAGLVEVWRCQDWDVGFVGEGLALGVRTIWQADDL